MSAAMEIGLESLDGRMDTVIVAKTSNNICGGMKIDVLIGLDHHNLLFPMKEVLGGDNDPSARLCPLR